MTYLGLDLGSKTCGIAISDRTGIIASSLEVIRYYDYEDSKVEVNYKDFESLRRFRYRGKQY